MEYCILLDWNGTGENFQPERRRPMMGSRARIVSLLLAFLFARASEPIAAAAAPAGSRHLTKDERWMNQRLDHFSPTVSQLPLWLPGLSRTGARPSLTPATGPRLFRTTGNSSSATSSSSTTTAPPAARSSCASAASLPATASPTTTWP